MNIDTIIQQSKIIGKYTFQVEVMPVPVHLLELQQKLNEIAEICERDKIRELSIALINIE